MRKGWFKKARKKFVKKRVYRWKFYSEFSSEEIEFLSGGWGGRSIIKFYSHDRTCQLLEKIRDLGNICQLIVNCNSEKFLTTITTLSLRNLELGIGSEVFISFKATDVKCV